MTELPQLQAGTTERPVAETTQNLAKVNRRAMDFLFDVQCMMLDELLFISNEMLDRAKTEAHLFTEFVSKLAEAHSVNNIRTLWEECGQHQIDFIRRDSERLFKHGQRIIETMSNLFDGRRLN
jgi:hypothetical protein